MFRSSWNAPVTSAGFGPGSFGTSSLLNDPFLNDPFFNDPFFNRNWPTDTGLGFGLGFSPFDVTSTDRDWWDQRNYNRGLLGAPDRFDRGMNRGLSNLDYTSRPLVDRSTISRTFPRHVGSTIMVDDQGKSIWRPSSDVFETENEIVIHVDLPGVQKEDVRIDVDKDSVVIHGESKRPEGYEAASSRVRERNIGAFRKIVYLPSWVKTDDLKANMDSGLLEVKVPKSEEAKSRRQISVQ